jgi:hypothetical protein
MLWFVNVCDIGSLKNERICPEGSYGLFLTCGEKKMGSVTQICSELLWSLLIKHNVCFFTHITSYILEQLSVVSNAVNESILAPLSKQPESFRSAREIGCPTTSRQWLSLAILSLACPDIADDRRLNSNTSKSQRHTSRLKQYKAHCYS